MAVEAGVEIDGPELGALKVAVIFDFVGMLGKVTRVEEFEAGLRPEARHIKRDVAPTSADVRHDQSEPQLIVLRAIIKNVDQYLAGKRSRGERVTRHAPEKQASSLSQNSGVLTLNPARKYSHNASYGVARLRLDANRVERQILLMVA